MTGFAGFIRYEVGVKRNIMSGYSLPIQDQVYSAPVLFTDKNSPGNFNLGIIPLRKYFFNSGFLIGILP
jgi:hypothetical protein